jgi:hypothetical protein
VVQEITDLATQVILEGIRRSLWEFAEGLPDLLEKNDGSVADVRSGTV